MNNYIQSEKAFDVIGISLRTTTKAAITEGTIGRLWQKFSTEDILAQIPNKIDNAIIAVYHDYENDKNGAYTLLIGAQVSSIEHVPSGFTAFHVPAQKMSIFISQTRQKKSVVIGLWKEIWGLEDTGKLDRNYIVDYELYDEWYSDPQNAQVEIHIGMRQLV